MTRSKNKDNKTLKAAPLAQFQEGAKKQGVGKPFGKTENQKDLIAAIEENDVVIVEGPAGCGKTYIGIGMGAWHLKEGLVKKIYITRPIVEAGEKLGSLPGSLEEKVDPYMQAVLIELYKFIGQNEVKALLRSDVIEILPLAFMRGRNLDHAYIYADECQNATDEQIQMLLSRIGQDSKLVVAGDSEQSDLPRHHKTYYGDFVDGFYEEQELETQPDDHLNRVEVCFLDESDIQRNKIIGSLLKVLRKIKARRSSL